MKGGTLPRRQNKDNRRMQFLPDRLVDLIFSHEIVPMVNQIEMHSFCQEKELRQIMAQCNIQPMAWAPFAEGQNDIFRNGLLSKIGKQYGKSSAQVILRWLYQNKLDIQSLDEVKRLHNIRFEQ